jgi:hypothetical protein
MSKLSRSQKILSEIELFLEAGQYEDVRVLLTFVDHDRFDRESQLRLLLINVRLDGPRAFMDDIAKLPTLTHLSDCEKALIEKISSLVRESTDEAGRKDRSPTDRAGPRLGELNVYPPMQSQVVEQTKLLQDREAELLTCQEIIRSREQRLSESRELLDSRNADILALGSRVTELTAQLAELNRAKDQEARLFHEELARRAELFQAQESTIANLRDRFAEQIDVLEAQLGETKNIAAARDAQIDSFKAKVSALIQEKAELISAGESAQRATQEEQRQQAGLLRAMESSLAEMEAQMGEQIRLLALQLEEKQNLLQNSRADLGNLRMQLCVLNQRVDEAEAAKIHAETLLHKDRSRASRSFMATPSSDYRPAGEPVPDPEPANAASRTGRDYSFPWLKWLRHKSPINWPAKAFPAGVLPVAGAGLLLLPIGYILVGPARTVSNPGTATRWEGTSEPADALKKARLSIPVSKTSADDDNRRESTGSAPKVTEQKTRKAAFTENRNAAGRGADQREPMAGYVTRRTVALREAPRYAAKAKTQIGPGTSVSVLDTQGNWLRVKTRQSGTIGYVRKEYLIYASSSR